MQQKVSYSRVFEKRGYRSPKKVYLGSFRIFGCLNYGRDLKKRGYRSPLSDTKLQIFLGVTYSCVLKKQNRSNRLAFAAFLKSVAIGPPKKEAYVGSFRIFGWCYL